MFEERNPIPKRTISRRNIYCRNAGRAVQTWRVDDSRLGHWLITGELEDAATSLGKAGSITSSRSPSQPTVGDYIVEALERARRR